MKGSALDRVGGVGSSMTGAAGDGESGDGRSLGEDPLQPMRLGTIAVASNSQRSIGRGIEAPLAVCGKDSAGACAVPADGPY
jgi:hypothetical protein